MAISSVDLDLFMECEKKVKIRKSIFEKTEIDKISREMFEIYTETQNTNLLLAAFFEKTKSEKKSKILLTNVDKIKEVIQKIIKKVNSFEGEFEKKNITLSFKAEKLIKGHEESDFKRKLKIKENVGYEEERVKEVFPSALLERNKNKVIISLIVIDDFYSSKVDLAKLAAYEYLKGFLEVHLVIGNIKTGKVIHIVTKKSNPMTIKKIRDKIIRYCLIKNNVIPEIVERNIKCESCDVKNLCLEKTKREKKRSLNLKSSLEKSYVEHEKKRETKELERELKKWTRPL